MIFALLALAVSAEPAYLRLGLDARAALTISCADVPVLAPNSGRVEGLHREGGAWRATYLPPASAMPRVALVGVFCGREPALLSLPLWGDGDAEVHARPHAVVSVRIGPEVFGPLRTDAQGVARVPVIVPPGVNFATQGPRAIDLHVPRTRTVHLVSLEDEVAVDRPHTLPLFAFVVDRSGAPLSSAPLRISASRGTLAAPVELAPGVYRIDWSLEAGAPGDVMAEATVDGDPDPAIEALRLVAGPPASIEVAGDRAEWTPGDGPVRLRTVVRDAAGNVLHARLRAHANLGSLRVRRGEVDVELPKSFDGDRELTVSLSAGAAKAQARISLRPDAPAKVRVVAARQKILADGRSAVRVRLFAVDRFGNEVESAPATSADVGSMSPPARTGDGWEATFVPPVLHDRGSALVNARTGEAAASARIELDPAVRPVAVSFRAGVFSNLHEVIAPVAGLVAALRTDWLDSQLGVQLSFDVLGWNTTDVLATTAGARGLRTTLGVGMPGIALEWRRPLSDRMAAWVEAGPLLAWASSSTQLAGTATQRDRGLSEGVQAGAGAELRLWQGKALAEARWIATRSFALANLNGPLSGLCLTLGYRVELF